MSLPLVAVREIFAFKVGDLTLVQTQRSAFGQVVTTVRGPKTSKSTTLGSNPVPGHAHYSMCVCSPLRLIAVCCQSGADVCVWLHSAVETLFGFSVRAAGKQQRAALLFGVTLPSTSLSLASLVKTEIRSAFDVLKV